MRTFRNSLALVLALALCATAAFAAPKLAITVGAEKEITNLVDGKPVTTREAAVESEPGSGSTFLLWLPATDLPPP